MSMYLFLRAMANIVEFSESTSFKLSYWFGVYI